MEKNIDVGNIRAESRQSRGSIPPLPLSAMAFREIALAAIRHFSPFPPPLFPTQMANPGSHDPVS
jgi:hypothetical protein